MKQHSIKRTSVKIAETLLDTKNPRHRQYSSQKEVIEYLCEKEKILGLAKDIAKHGINPLEIFAVIKKGGKYFTAEGNRRLCALKLLNNPNLAPSKWKKRFEKAAGEWENPIDSIEVTEFESRKDVELWLNRIHGGLSGGRGRKQWNAEQKARNSDYDKNNLALNVLDACENKGYISEEDREGKITIVQRFLNNTVMREIAQLHRTENGKYVTKLSKNDFKLIFTKFMSDIISGEIDSRKYNKTPEIEKYAHSLKSIKGLTGKSAPARNLEDDLPTKSKIEYPQPPEEPKSPNKLAHNLDIESGLKKIGNYKLQKIYFSICKLSLKQHAPLILVGVWMFIESLTRSCGSTTDFPKFINSKLHSLGFTNKDDNKSIRQVLERISKVGDTTKHDKSSAGFDKEQIASDFNRIQDLLLALVELAKKQEKEKSE